ncbi:MAG TPA: ATP-binding protein [Longimicrobiales bacterium]|nr:ATP-binding protein [Longimicrobiales bacterium]
MSEIQKLREELRQSESRFLDVIERNADAIVVVDQSGVIRFANQEAKKLFAGAADDLIGNSFGFPLVAGETTELDLLVGPAPINVEMRVVESHWEGQPACIASLRDCTQRKIEEQHTRELIRANTARAVAEDVAGRFRFLAESTSVLAASLEYSDTISALAKLCVDEIADWVIIYSFEGTHLKRTEVAHCDVAKGDVARKLRDYPINHESDAVAALVRTRTPQLAEHIDDAALEAMTPDAEQRAIIKQLGVSSFMIVPMVARDRLLGAISFIASTPDKSFHQADLHLAVDLASRAALAIDNARLYEEARQANQSKTELLAIISHDLRTPLNSILGYGQLMKMGIPEPLPAGSLVQLDRMLISAKHQLYLIDELLTFARLDSDHEDVELTAADVREPLNEAATLIQPVADEKGLTLHLELPDEPLQTRTDPDKLRQVVINLLANAVRYTESGEVRLSAERCTSGDVIVRVHDTGIGISDEHLPHVFEPFWQVDSRQRTQGGGTGLGLAVVKQTVALLGGSVSAKSEIGVGSTFEVCLPGNVD